MEYVKGILEQMKEMLEDQLNYTKDLEFTETKQRLKQVEDALLILNSSSLQLPCKEENSMDEEYYKQKFEDDLQWEENMNSLYDYREDGFCDGFTNQ